MKKIHIYLLALISFLFFFAGCIGKEANDDKEPDSQKTLIVEKEQKEPKSQLNDLDFDNSNIILELLSANKNIELEILTAENSPVYITGGIPEEIYGNGKSVNVSAINKKIGLTGKIISLKIARCENIDNLNFLSAPLLDNFACSYSSLSSIDFSGAPNLKNIELGNNKNMSTINTGNLTLLESLDIENSKIEKTDLTNNLNLKRFLCSKTNIDNIDISKNVKLEFLDVSDLSLKKLNVKNNPELQELNCSSNNLKILDLSENQKLKKLNCKSNDIIDLALFANNNLEFIDCGKNKLDKLFLENNKNLKTIFCNDNKLKTLDLLYNKDIENIYCFNNEITEIKLNKNSALKNIFCFNNCIEEDKALFLFNSLPAGNGYDFHTIVWYADKNDGINYDYEKYFDGNFILPKEIYEKAYGNYWYVYHTLYGLEEINEILNSLSQKN